MENAVTEIDYDNQSVERQVKLLVRGQAGGFEVEWDEEAKVTPSGTVVLSILNGHTRYAHINALRNDRVGPEVLGMSKMVSEDSVRRALKRAQPQTWDAWLLKQ